MSLRPELLRFAREDGGLDLLDPLLDRLHPLDRARAGQLARWEAGAPEPELEAWLDARLLIEGPAAEAVRTEAYAAKARVRAAPRAGAGSLSAAGESGDSGSGSSAGPPAAAGPWDCARDLPTQVAARWREPEPWRRLAEARVAGAALLRVEGFLVEPAWRALRQACLALEPQRLETELVSAARHLLGPETLPDWQSLVGGEALRALAGAALGVGLGPKLTTNAWRFDPGDHMHVHPDGPRYDGTYSLGLNADWRAAHGGAIAFGVPGSTGFAVAERWLPHGGDLLLFAPHARSWHCVEPVRAGLRLTLTGWWSTP